MHYINKTRFFILTVILTLLFSVLVSYAKYVSRDISESVVRLHIIANSNSDTDQQLKLRIRDRILNETTQIFDNSTSPKEALRCAKQNSKLIAQIAADEIKNCGFDYNVEVKIGNFPFPTKIYNDIMLPAGSYNAVRIEIGSAQGENWWCVMYPPLCFTDGVVSISEESRNQLKASLSESEYNLITGQDSGAIPVEIRFKIVEILQGLFHKN